MAYATILIPGSGIIAAFAGNAKQLNDALGIFLLTWTLITAFLA